MEIGNSRVSETLNIIIDERLAKYLKKVLKHTYRNTEGVVNILYCYVKFNIYILNEI